MTAWMKPLVRPLTSARFDVFAGRLACWVAAILVLVLGFFKLTQLPLSETELFFGLLLVLAVTMQMILFGLVLPQSESGT